MFIINITHKITCVLTTNYRCLWQTPTMFTQIHCCLNSERHMVSHKQRPVHTSMTTGTFSCLLPFPSKVFRPHRETRDPIWTYFPQRNHLRNDSYASHKERRIKLALNFSQSFKANPCLHLLSTMYPVQGLFPSHCWEHTVPAPDNLQITLSNFAKASEFAGYKWIQRGQEPIQYTWEVIFLWLIGEHGNMDLAFFSAINNTSSLKDSTNDVLTQRG